REGLVVVVAAGIADRHGDQLKRLASSALACSAPLRLSPWARLSSLTSSRPPAAPAAAVSWWTYCAQPRESG
ncbi:hypothetical protein, partial [Nocardia cyriacigeorgica]|uniref:hypothetical protein n=1 Tax=Nocardia cyriacigeorgica TaxID=135487 RepID=UPI002457FBE1